MAKRRRPTFKQLTDQLTKRPSSFARPGCAQADVALVGERPHLFSDVDAELPEGRGKCSVIGVNTPGGSHSREPDMIVAAGCA
eukprot:6895854-Prymnesium_polylepis.2